MIKELELNPYPRKLWIVKNESLEQLEDKFNLTEDQKEIIISGGYKGLALSVSKKSNNHAGYMVIMFDDFDSFTSIHEAVHVVLDMYSDLGMDISCNMDQEPFAYYVEYVFKLLENEANT